MGLRTFINRLGQSAEDLDRQRLREFCESHAGVVNIEDVHPRDKVTVVGEITTLRIVPGDVGVSWLEATISDVSGKITVKWSGRRHLAGVHPGRRMVVSGRTVLDRHQDIFVIYNPAYELL